MRAVGSCKTCYATRRYRAEAGAPRTHAGPLRTAWAPVSTDGPEAWLLISRHALSAQNHKSRIQFFFSFSFFHFAFFRIFSSISFSFWRRAEKPKDLKSAWRCLNPLSLTPSRLPRFSANQQNLKTLRKTFAERERPLARVDQGNDSKT